ncbi:zinc finger Ran-binding domain-containing protein [Catenuloplanes atrovinosus]|uniref:RanBP2-type domain-containing protein n=1 Tax=Catenuloplanes atrovinosus TaxID=137266 RepID=A0AAE3YT46_9ACTN|nr:zinc finger Ran-binding domain-containing protein [Catenuloplanes atrovinosus]MDR7278132.1 hypothetical protein [Catenuloplanes atrovinosus]
MIEWRCPECGTANDASAPRCLVCDGAAPEAAVVAMTSLPGTHRRRAPEPSDRWRLAGIAAVVLAVLLAAGYLILDTGPESAAGTTAPGSESGSEAGAASLAAPEATVREDAPGVPDAGVPDEGLTWVEPSPVTEAGTAYQPPPTRAGLVSIAPEAAADHRAAEIAALFDTYFTGINAHDPTVATRVFAPGGVVDPGDATQVAAFNADTATTQDSDVWLLAVDGDVATVSFTSSQAPGYGPPERPAETCTDWRLDFLLTADPLIMGTAPGAVSAPCA